MLPRDQRQWTYLIERKAVTLKLIGCVGELVQTNILAYLSAWFDNKINTFFDILQVERLFEDFKANCVLRYPFKISSYIVYVIKIHVAHTVWHIISYLDDQIVLYLTRGL